MWIKFVSFGGIETEIKESILKQTFENLISFFVFRIYMSINLVTYVRIYAIFFSSWPGLGLVGLYLYVLTNAPVPARWKLISSNRLRPSSSRVNFMFDQATNGIVFFLLLLNEIFRNHLHIWLTVFNTRNGFLVFDWQVIWIVFLKCRYLAGFSQSRNLQCLRLYEEMNAIKFDWNENL